jgi:hypothetical protein
MATNKYGYGLGSDTQSSLFDAFYAVTGPLVYPFAAAYEPLVMPSVTGATDDVTFSDASGGSYDLVLTVSGSNGLGVVTGITGSADGVAVTGLSTDFGADNTVVSTTAPQFDNNGLAFSTANGDTYVLYDYDAGVTSGLYIQDMFETVPTLPIQNETFTVEPLCFLRGTRILTPSGEVAVEDLNFGTTVTTVSGTAAKIRWIGQGKMLCPSGRRSAATPVIVRRHALADNMPSRDLRVTKGHALYVDGVLIPAEFLVNHRSILWDDTAQEVEFFHVELPSHDVILAEGAPAESYRDEGNRWMFFNANPAWDRPGVAPYAPVLTGGPIVDAAWQRLLKRSGERLDIPTTADADLHLLVNGVRVNGTAMVDGWVSFALPAGAERIAIASRFAAQDELGLSRDPRRLGVALARIVLWRRGVSSVIEADDPALVQGFHKFEPDEDCIWTDGHALVPTDRLEGLPKPNALHLQVRMTTRYPVQQAAAPRLKAA